MTKRRLSRQTLRHTSSKDVTVESSVAERERTPTVVNRQVNVGTVMDAAIIRRHARQPKEQPIKPRRKVLDQEAGSTRRRKEVEKEPETRAVEMLEKAPETREDAR